MKKLGLVFICALMCSWSVFGAPQEKKIYWGDDVPKGWNGSWPAKFLSVPERTNYAKTTSSYEIHEFIDMLKWNSENVGVINVFTSGLRKVCSAVVMANPRITTPEEAKASGKPVIYIQGNIHPPEAEAKEALLMLMRDILLGKKKYLLDNQIIICCPCFNVDGNDTWATTDGTPHIIGTRTNMMNYDLNRDAIKLETIEVNGLYRSILNRWDPVFLYDGHAMGRVKHGYAIVYATSTVPTAHPGPRGYVFDTMFPALRESVRKDFGLEIFTHCMYDEENWPPTVWSHDRAIWSTEGKFVASAFGLRNRMSILAETPGHPSFERKIYAHYALVHEILEYTNTHGKEMAEICKKADEDVVNKVLTQAESGELRNFVEGKYESWGKVDLLAYRKNEGLYIPGTSVRARTSASALGAPELVHGVEHLTKSVGTKEAAVPRGYLIPAELGFLADKLRAQNIKIEVLDKPVRVSGEEFVIDRMIKNRSWGYDMTKLLGGFFKGAVKEFPAGTFRVDMAQPLANLAFYCLEPEVGDNFVGWGLLDNYLKSLGVTERSIVYPIFKYFKVIE
jgi:hypothetical protein